MNGTSFHNGNPVYYEGIWRYADNGIPINGARRACPHCGKRNNRLGHDGCITNLPGTKAACCGHGGNGVRYVLLEDGTVLKGLDALNYMLAGKQ